MSFNPNPIGISPNLVEIGRRAGWSSEIESCLDDTIIVILELSKYASIEKVLSAQIGDLIMPMKTKETYIFASHAEDDVLRERHDACSEEVYFYVYRNEFRFAVPTTLWIRAEECHSRNRLALFANKTPPRWGPFFFDSEGIDITPAYVLDAIRHSMKF